jgi:hypothetical protein
MVLRSILSCHTDLASFFIKNGSNLSHLKVFKPRIQQATTSDDAKQPNHEKSELKGRVLKYGKAWYIRRHCRVGWLSCPLVHVISPDVPGWGTYPLAHASEHLAPD